MNNHQDKPLITISMMTYNQERYVRESVCGMLAQTYEPLEIVISDDCSTDRTWEIVNEEVERYKISGGGHKIILNRNEANLGIAKHFEKHLSLCHGVLLICNAGDDVSVPNRVECIVSKWMEFGNRAMVIIHDGIKIDHLGRQIGLVGRRSIEAPLGACMAYSSKIFNIFDGIVEPGCFEDHVYGRRASLLGEVLIIDDKLVRYRVGTGVSSVLYSRRRPELRAAQGRIASYRQSLHDIEFLRNRRLITNEQFLKLESDYNNCIERNELFVQLASSGSAIKRFAAYKKLYLADGVNFSALLRVPYLLPRSVGDLMYLCYGVVIRYIRRLKR